MTNKNLPSLKKSTEVALSRANTLMDMADKILSKQSTDLAVDEDWMERLWKWADANDIGGDNLPRDKDNLVNLKFLYLCCDKLTELPKKLTELPKEIFDLVNLRYLKLSDNQLTELPKEIFDLVNLTHLDLNDNQLTELPKEIGNLVNLTQLYLHGNQLSELPKEITNLTNLTWLNLSKYYESRLDLLLTTEQRQWTKNIDYVFPKQL